MKSYQDPLDLKIPYQKQKQYVILISLGFLSIFTAYSPLETIITKLYINFGYQNFGPISLGILYITYAFSTSLASNLIGIFGFKKTLMFGAVSYTLFQSSGLIVFYYGDNHIIAWLTVVGPAFLCGFSAACIWVAQSGYIGNISSFEHRDEMFGIFVAFRGCATVLGFFLNLYLLTYFPEDVYFKVLIPVGALSLLFFYLLPYTDQIEARYAHEKIEMSQVLQKLKNYFKIFGDRNNLSIYYYSLTPGMLAAMGAVLMYQIGLSTVPKQVQGQTKEEYTRREDGQIAVYLFCFAISQVIIGFFMKRLAAAWSSYEIAHYGSYGNLMLTILTFLVYCLFNFQLNCLMAFAWGVLTTIHRANCFTLYSKHFNNDLKMFGVFQFFNAFGCAVFIFLITVTSKISIFASFGLIIFTFGVITWYSYEYRDLQTPTKDIETELIEK